KRTAPRGHPLGQRGSPGRPPQRFLPGTGQAASLAAKRVHQLEGWFMPSYLSPGVYMEEVPAGSRPIEGVGTAVAAFVGLAERGPVNQATLVTNWSQFTGTFGKFIPGSYLAHAVYGYYQNGGGACYVVRVGV